MFGGTGKDPAFELETDNLPEGLVYLADPAKPEEHGLICPAYTMAFDYYQRLIHETRELWQRV